MPSSVRNVGSDLESLLVASRPDVVARVRGWNQTCVNYPRTAAVGALFAARAAAGPDLPAIREGGRVCRYGEVEGWSNRLAHRLRDEGVETGEPVGVLGGRRLEAPVAMLGILKAGGAYVPLDPELPPARLARMVRELGLRWVVALGDADMPGVGVLPVADYRGGDDPGPPSVDVDGGSLAYILFTSGSTGVPKAVAVRHRSVVRLVTGADYVSFRPGDQVANTTHPLFDVSVFEIWGALLNGGCLIVVDNDTLVYPKRLEGQIVTDGIDTMWLTTGVFHQAVRQRPGMFTRLRQLIVGGDMVGPEPVRRVLAAGPPGALVNGYGPTENCAFSTAHRIEQVHADQTRIPIGRPIANSTCYVMRPDGRLADAGEEGELLVGGDGVAAGYINDPELTRQRFVPDPFSTDPEARLYRTGDLAAWQEDGTLDFFGRADRQVKVTGFRIELDDVEAHLSGHPGVGGAAVLAEDVGTDWASLTAYVTPRDEATPADEELRAFLAQRLPQYMLPARYVHVSELPLNPAGKVDRGQLAGLRSGHTDPAPERTLRTSTEVLLAEIWRHVLQVDQVTAADSFFDLGGNSLLAAQVFAHLQEVFGVGAEQGRFLTRRLLADPRLEACAEAVERARAGTLTQDDRGHPVDFAAEARMDPLPDVPRTSTRSTATRHILLTGGSGFIGTYLLEELLHGTNAEIHCLVRAADDQAARARLEMARQRYALGGLPSGRVHVVACDLGKPALGLDEGRFTALADTVDLIVHAAAYVNFTYPYHHLAPVTVGGTRELVRMATHSRAVPIHFVSTIAVLSGFGAAGVRDVTEDTPLAFPELLHMGYVEAKWVAEGVLRDAAHAGLPVSVYRPYEVVGDLTSGDWNLENATCALIKSVVDTGIAPNIALPMDLLPVDVLAKQLVHIVLSRVAHSATYHLSNPSPSMFAHVVDRLRHFGYRVRTVPFEEWLPFIARYAAAHPSHPIAAFIPMWNDRNPVNGLRVKELYFAEHFPSFSRDNAERALADCPTAEPPVDDALLDQAIRSFQHRGFLALPRTAEAGRTEPWR